MPTILTWNVAGRIGERCAQQIERVRSRQADIVCLQEVTPNTRERWREGLQDAGYTVTISEWVTEPRGPRRFGVLIATPGPATAVAVPGLPWPERHLAVQIDDTIVHTLHSPTSFKEDLVKVRTLEALSDAALASPTQLRVIAGDINTPRYESREGVITSFARTQSGKIRPHLGERHDLAELALIQELPRHGWSDAFRAVHGYQRRDRSWRAGRGYGYRLDHILLSPGLAARDCDYIHEWREEGLSDHSAMWATYEADA